MEIHSSSLSFFTARENPKNNQNISLSSPLKKDNKSALTIPPSQAKKLTDAEIGRIQSLSNDVKEQQNIASNIRSSQALNLYRQENRQSLQNQGAGLISKIDFFI